MNQASEMIGAMTETFKAVLLILFIIGALFLVLRISAWKMKKAGDFIIGDLKRQKAFDPASAVELPYRKSSMLNIGLRDYRPHALQELINQDVVCVLEGDRYYLHGG